MAACKTSLNIFSTYSEDLDTARNNLIYKLGTLGFKMTFEPRFT